MEDYCGNLNGSETLSNTAGDYAELSFTGQESLFMDHGIFYMGCVTYIWTENSGRKM